MAEDMTAQRKYWILVLGLALLAAACGPRYLGISKGGPVVFEKDSSEWMDKDNGGLHLEITDFQWRYIARSNHMEISGHVKNLSGKRVQSVRITAESFDQFDKSLGSSETYIMPSLLAPDEEGDFRFYLDRGDWVKAVHIRYRFVSRI